MKQLKTASDKQKPKYDFLNLNFYGVSTVDWKPAFGYNDCGKAAGRNIIYIAS